MGQVLTICEYDENTFQTGYFTLAAEKVSSMWITYSGVPHNILKDNTMIQATHQGLIQEISISMAITPHSKPEDQCPHQREDHHYRVKEQHAL